MGGRRLLAPPDRGFNMMSRNSGVLVLPDADHLPAGDAQRFVDGRIPGLVPGDLRAPVSGVSPGRGVVLGTAVPEAPIDEYRHLRATEDQVSGAAKVRQRPRGHAI